MAIDYAESRRHLRRARVVDALGMQRDGVDVPLHRDRLLTLLAERADHPVDSFDELDQNAVDAVVSLALSELVEKPEDSLLVVLLCGRVLAADGQFARLSLLANRVQNLSRRLETARPYATLGLSALADCFRGAEDTAIRDLERGLGLKDGRAVVPQPIVRSQENVNDLLMATVLLQSLRSGSEEFARKSREVAVRVGDGFLLAFIECVQSWTTAANAARLTRVLPTADPTFATATLARYLARLERRIPVLYPPQIKAAEGGATQDRDVVVALPTSSGKTLIAELRSVAHLSRHPGSRVIYVAPYRLLARQVERSFRDGLSAVNMTVRDLGSGFDPTLEIDGFPDVVICTPERLDALMRLATSSAPGHEDAAELFDTAGLLIFDELQLIGRGGRGHRFDLIITRLRLRNPGMRLLGLCAASQGTEALSHWLTGNDPIQGAKRPTGTLEIVWGVDGTLKQRAGDRQSTVGSLGRSKAADDAAKLISRLVLRSYPVLAVETSRPNAENLARRLLRNGPQDAADWREGLQRSERVELNGVVEEVRSLLGADHPLAECIEGGVAFHHAGVPTHLLAEIERLAARRLLRVVCATTTVAEGADLPFRSVVIPHLNFPGTSSRLDRDLYLNIVGRAGRANVSMEGMVFILDSNAATLKNVVRSSLWSNTMADRITGRLSDVETQADVSSVDEWNYFQDVQSQVMGWLGDGSSYVEDQAQVLGQETFSWATGSSVEKRHIGTLIQDSLADLEQNGYALAASPYRLTRRGKAARLTGLAIASVTRLERALTSGYQRWLKSLVGKRELDAEDARIMAELIFEGVEAIEHSLWLARTAKTPAARVELLTDIARGDDETYRSSEERKVDLSLLTAWISGAGYAELADIAPEYSHSGSLFGGSEVGKRTSDATQYIGKLVYPATWVWAGIRVLTGPLGEELPTFLRQAVEFGLPNEGCVDLVVHASMSRVGAKCTTEVAGASIADVRGWLAGAGDDEVWLLGLTTADRDRLLEYRDDLSMLD